MNDELRNFFEVAFALRNTCAESDDSLKDEKIDVLVQVCSAVVRVGEIPEHFYITGCYPLHTELVKELFDTLSIKITPFRRDVHDTSSGKVFSVDFCTV